MLVFELAERRLALAGDVVHEVVRAVAISALPKAPAVVEGVVNWRGRIVPVLDIRARFGMPPVPLTPDQHFVFAQAGSRVVALRVDRAVDLIRVDESAVETAAAAAVPGAEYVVGIAKLADGLLVIHDLDRFLSLDEGAQLDAAVGGALARRAK
ncbi:MAG: purine-binding chemotaxis protein CheW [Gemmatimonadetes bacterium]|nr:purine-binding chemotaxis protein CheW [Gemmatimonadota bacterium]